MHSIYLGRLLMIFGDSSWPIRNVLLSLITGNFHFSVIDHLVCSMMAHTLVPMGGLVRRRPHWRTVVQHWVWPSIVNLGLGFMCLKVSWIPFLNWSPLHLGGHPARSKDPSTLGWLHYRALLNPVVAVDDPNVSSASNLMKIVYLSITPTFRQLLAHL